MSIKVSIQRRYVFGPGADEPIVWYDGADTSDRRWLQADERGSIVALSSATGALMQVNRYDEYGVPQWGNLGRFGYTGQAWLPQIGLYNFKARMYSPTLGRFLQTDPIGYADGMNWYAYVGNDPVNRVDPGGSELVQVGGETFDTVPIVVVATGTGAGNGIGGGGLAGRQFEYQDNVFDGPSRNKGVIWEKPCTDPYLCNLNDAEEEPQWTQSPSPCQLAFLKSQLGSRGLPTDQLDSLKFVSGLDSNANALTRRAFNGGASAVTQGSTVYVQPGSFNTVANFRSPTGFEEAYHTAQFASDSGFYSTYGILSIGGLLAMGDSYNGNVYEAFAKGASRQMFEASKSGMCSK